MSVELAIVVLNYRTPDLAIGCLESLAPQMAGDRRVIVVDNASGDGSAERIERAIAERGWGAWAELLRSPVNGGFAAGNNLGVRAIDARSYLLLNSDTIVRPGALDALLDARARHPRAGLIGPRLETPDGAKDPSTFRELRPLGELVRAASIGPVTRALRRWDAHLPTGEEPAEVGWVGFACVLVRREVFDEIGGLDDGYFMYFEDVDFSRRARAAGWASLYWPAARVVHLGGASSGVREDVPKPRPRYYYEARSRYFAKFHGRAGPIGANVAWLAGATLSRARAAAGLGGRRPHEREGADIWIHAFDPFRASSARR